MPPPKPLTLITLEPGQYLVEVFYGSANRALTWRHESGLITGHGSRMRRPSLPTIFGDLHMKWEDEAGISSDTLSHPELVAVGNPEIPQEAIDRVTRAAAEHGRACADLQVLIGNSAAGRDYRRRHPS
jgi:hypothetical protein